jgi:phage terminase large subunit GpA-like protein
MLWPLGVDTAKSRVYARLKIGQLTDEEKRQGVRPITGGPGFMHFPLGLPDAYYAGLVAERLVTRYRKGYAVRVWEKDAGVANEPLDLTVGCYGAGIYAGVGRMNWDKVEAAMRFASADLFVAADRARELAAAVQTKGVDAGAADEAATDAAPPKPETPRASEVLQTSAKPAEGGSSWVTARPDWLRRR